MVRALALAPFWHGALGRLARSLEVSYQRWMDSRKLLSPDEVPAIPASRWACFDDQGGRADTTVKSQVPKASGGRYTPATGSKAGET